MYHKMKFGKYEGYTLDHIPMEYLMWLFGVMSYKKKDRELYQENIILISSIIHILKLMEPPDLGYKPIEL